MLTISDTIGSVSTSALLNHRRVAVRDPHLPRDRETSAFSSEPFHPALGGIEMTMELPRRASLALLFVAASGGADAHLGSGECEHRRCRSTR